MPLTFAANLSMLFTERPFHERFQAAADAGFTKVEMINPYVAPPQAIRELCEEAGVEVVLFNTPVFDWDDGGRGLAAIPGQEGMFRAGFEMALDYADVLRPRFIHVMSGLAEGDAAQKTFLSNLRWAAAIASDQGLTIEPINPHDMPGYYLNDFELAAQVISAVAAPNLALQFDAYHAQRITGDVMGTWERFATLARHIQIANTPGRHEPDTGDIDVPAFFAQLQADGYDGVIGAEYLPKGQTEEGLGWLHDLQGS